MSSNSPKRPDRDQTSPPRTQLEKDKFVVKAGQGKNPEHPIDDRTLELATDQSIAARNLIKRPNDGTLAVVDRCADGVNFVMGRLAHTDDVDGNLAKDQILISMVTRLMADGSTGRIIGFNAKLAELRLMKNEIPRPDIYAEEVRILADACRANMSKITTKAKIPGPEGALARQGLLAFMGDLGGLEKNVTGFGQAFEGKKEEGAGFPLCGDAKLVYDTYVAGVCDAQHNINGQQVPATTDEVTRFEASFAAARAATSLKGGVLSAPVHTQNKQGERAAQSFDVLIERQGLLNTGDMAEAVLKKAYPGDEKTLVDAAWPGFVVSGELLERVIEPVTGHVSGTFGEMVGSMNMFCGTPPDSVSRDNPAGDPVPSAGEDQVTAITALAAAGLITAGFHSAVEVFQPMSTFSTQATYQSIGPTGVKNTNNQAAALRDYANHLKDNPGPQRPSSWEHNGYALSEEELNLKEDELERKAESLEFASTKAVDFIAMLQGGGTLATLEVSRVMANHSTEPTVVMQLFSNKTRLEQLGQGGSTPCPRLEDARNLATLFGLPCVNDDLLELSTRSAELGSERKKLEGAVEIANPRASQLETRADTLEIESAEKNKALKTARSAFIAATAADKVALLSVSIDAYRASVVAKAEALVARAEATAARAEATAIDKKIADLDEEIAAIDEEIKLVRSVLDEKLDDQAVVDEEPVEGAEQAPVEGAEQAPVEGAEQAVDINKVSNIVKTRELRGAVTAQQPGEDDSPSSTIGHK